MAYSPKQTPHCSFCGEAENKEKGFVLHVGLSAIICDSCNGEEKNFTPPGDSESCSFCNLGRENQEPKICSACRDYCSLFRKGKDREFEHPRSSLSQRES